MGIYDIRVSSVGSDDKRRRERLANARCDNIEGE